MSKECDRSNDQKTPESRPAEASAPLVRPEPVLTAAQQALARAQAARAAYATNPPTGEGGANPTASQKEPEDLDAVIDGVLFDLQAQSYLTFVFLAVVEGSPGMTVGRGPSTDTAVCLAYHLQSGYDVEDGRLHWFYGPGSKTPDEAAQQTIQTVQTCLDRMRRHDEVTFILAWHVEDTREVHLDTIGYTPEAALAEIGDLLAQEIQCDLC